MKNLISSLLLVAFSLVVIGCGGASNSSKSDVETQEILTIEQAEKIAGPIVYLKNIAIVKDSNSTATISDNSSEEYQKLSKQKEVDLTEQLTLTQMIFWGTSDKIAVI